MITQHQVECFLWAARLGNFTRAAEQLYLSQPAISKQISALEEELDCSLFLRSRHSPVRLTAEGELYCAFFEQYEGELQAVRRRVRELSGREAGELRLGVLSGWNTAACGLPGMLEAFQRECPGTSVTFQFLDMAELREELIQNRLDAAVTIGESIPTSVPLEQHCFAQVRRVLLYSAGHHVTERPGGPAVEAFGDWEFAIVADQVFASDKLALSYLRPYGIQPKIRLVPSVEGAISLAHSGRCIALIDEWSREVDNNQFRVLPLDSCNHAVFAWDPVRRSPLVERFLTACWPDAHKPG